MKGKAVALLGVLCMAIVAFGCQMQPQSISQPLSVAPSPASGSVCACPSTGKTDGQVKYEDKLASTTTFLSTPTVYFTSDETADVTAGTLSTSDFSTAVSLECGKRYTPVAISDSDVSNSAVGSSFVACGSKATQTLSGKKMTNLTVKVKELVNDVYANISSLETAAGSYTAFVELHGTATNVTDQPGYTAFTVAADGYLDLRIDVKTTETQRVYGEDGLNTYLCVNANSDKWSEPRVSISGSALTDVFDSLSREDQKALNGYEYCYNIGSIGDVTRSIGFYMKTASGVNPGTSDLPVLRFVAEGKFQSSKEVDAQGDKKILTGAFADDTSNTEVASTDAQAMTIKTS